MHGIVMGRVDPRLVHGRILPKWTEACGADQAVIIDEVTAEDEYMAAVYEQTGSRQNIKVSCFSIDAFVAKEQAGDFEGHRLLALFSDIETARTLAERGVALPKLNIGAVVRKDENYHFINRSVAVTKEMMEGLLALSQGGTEVFIQSVPDADALTLEEARQIFDAQQNCPN